MLRLNCLPRVPVGAQCNTAIGSLQLFLNAGTVLVLGNEGLDGDAFQLSGEAFVKTGPDKGCMLTVGGTQIRVHPKSSINISAYDQDDSCTIALGRGSATMDAGPSQRVEFTASQVLVRWRGCWQTDRTGINPAAASGWISGRPISRNQPLAGICPQLGRLYGTHILLTMQDTLPGLYDIPYREMTLREVLGSLEQAPQLHSIFRADSILLECTPLRRLTL